MPSIKFKIGIHLDYNGYKYVTKENQNMRSKIIKKFVDEINRTSANAFRTNTACDFLDDATIDCRSNNGKKDLARTILQNMEFHFLSIIVGSDKSFPTKTVILQMRVLYAIIETGHTSKEIIEMFATRIKDVMDSFQKTPISLKCPKPLLKGFVHEGSPPNLPEILNKPLNIDAINGDSSIEEIVSSLIFPIMDTIVFPKTTASLRPTRCWKSLATKYLNYISMVALMFKFQNDNDYPTELKVEGLPEWWFVVRFANHFCLPGSSSFELNHKKSTGRATVEDNIQTKQKEIPIKDCLNIDNINKQQYSKCSLEERVNISYRKILYSFLLSGSSRTRKYETGVLDCLPDLRHKRPPIFNDMNDFISKYQKRYTVGVYDDTFWNDNKRKCTTEERTDELLTIASHGLHIFEIQIMENVLQSSPLDNSFPYRQFANCLTDKIPES